MKMPDLGKQIGPLPLGAWIIVVAGGLGIALYTRNQGAGGPVEVEDNSGTPGVGTGPGWTAVPPPSTPPDEDDNEIETNEQWARRAVELLTARGMIPVDADRAIARYLAAQPLTAGEKVMVNIAIGVLGAPPVPPGVPVDPDPTPSTPTPAPPRVTGLRVGTVTARSGVLRWSGIQNWWRYRIYRLIGTQTRIVADVTATSGGVASVSYEIKGLNPNTSYTNFVVVAVNAQGKQGPFSNMVSFRTKSR